MQTELTSYTNHRLNLDLYTSIFTPEQAAELFTTIETAVPWPKPDQNHRRRVNQNYGDPGVSYRLEFGGYNGKPLKIIERAVRPWDELSILPMIRDYVAEITQSHYNYCVVQRYPTGNVGIKPHRDREMRPDTAIAGLSLGATRVLSMSYRDDVIKIPLPPGSLYVLRPPTNSYWAHSIDVDPTITDVRLSLTFRLH
jgi:alkylated DNA repair dioxygenase AlkB